MIKESEEGCILNIIDIFPKEISIEKIKEFYKVSWFNWER